MVNLISISITLGEPRYKKNLIIRLLINSWIEIYLKFY